MATNLDIDTILLDKAYEISGLRTKKDTVNTALKEFIQKRQTNELISLFGQIEYDDSYNYKKARNKK